MSTNVELPGYKITELLYTGIRTLVYRAIRERDGENVVIKLLRNEYPNFNELLQLCNQYSITKNLEHCGVIKPISLEVYGNSYALIMKDYGGISLSDYLKTTGTLLSIEEFLKIAIQLTEILHYLYQQKIIHKDIKPANILIHPQSKQVKLIDFSISCLLPKETQEIKNANALEGTLAYLSPEQTGRMNRVIDYRSDFYSLGVTFYKLLTGELPFTAEDALEIVHSHLAKQPIPINQINPQIPPVLAEIVSKLMAKNPEQRYQTALGIKVDLKRCLNQLNITGKIDFFEIGKQDISDRFIIPEKLYGRDKEVEELLAAFDRVSQGNAEIIMVAGFSGIGKTTVINEVHKPIVRQRGYFIKGKFDQFNRNIPFSAFVQAFRDLMGQILSESEAKLQTWKAKILEAVGENGEVLIDVIPELENLLGKQPPAPQLSAIGNQNRFNLLFQKFVEVFTQKEHPVAIFLDDLQWADNASLNLLKLLIKETSYLLLLGAYRDNEVSPIHPFILTIDEIAKTGTKLHTITLPPLREENLNQLVAETLNCQSFLAQPLTKLIYQKTQGNPFFATQFLKALHDEEYITFNWEIQHWQCDMARINAHAITDNVVEFMAIQLLKLPKETQELLKLAACIGAQFDLETLAIVSEKSPTTAATELWKALQEGLVIPTSKIYKFFNQSEANQDLFKISANPSYQFLHDRVQQAIYSLIPEENKQTIHHHIGQLLLREIAIEDREERIFELVNQLNYGLDFIRKESERNELAQLNFMAGCKAKATTAYQAAHEYATTGLSLLPVNVWKEQYNQALAFHELAAETAMFFGDFEQMNELINIVIQQARSILDVAKVYEFRIQVSASQNRLLEALNISQEIFNLLGVRFPETPTTSDIQQAMSEVEEIMGDKKVEDLLDLPVMTDPEKLAIMRIFTKVVPAASNSGSILFELLICLAVKLSIQYGNTSNSAHAYANYSVLLCNFRNEINLAVQFGQLALEVVYKLNAIAIESAVLTVVALFSKHLNCHIRESIPLYKKAVSVGLETGDLEHVGYSSYALYYAWFWCGEPLTNLEPEIKKYTEELITFNQLTTAHYCKICWQSILNLLEGNKQPTILSGLALQQSQSLSLLLSTKDLFGLYSFYLYKMMLCFLFEEIEAAENNATEVRRYFNSVLGQMIDPIFYFYDSLIALSPLTGYPQDYQQIERVLQNQQKLQISAYYAPMNYQHKFDLVAAEQCRILGRKSEALELYEKAILGAKENGYIQEEALSNELAAKFYLSWGKDKIAAGYMQEAYFCYARWGAKTKIMHLEKKYHQLLKRIIQSPTSLISPELTITSLFKNSTSPISHENLLLDFLAVTKAAQAISAELELDQLLTTLMETTVANAGAQTGILLIEEEGELFVVATAQQNHKQILHIPLTNYPKIPHNLIYSVARSHKNAVFDDLSASHQFAADDYVATYQPKSVLCTPITKKGKLIAILYLENNIILAAFNQERIATIQVITSQAAVSIENARLYRQVENYSQTLEAEVEKKTKDLNQKAMDLEQVLKNLQQTQSQLIQSEKMSAMGQLVAGIAHEINNPINFIVGNIDYTANYVKDLLDLLAIYQEEYPEKTPRIQTRIDEIELEYIWDDLTKILQSMKVGSERIQQIIISLRNFSRLDEATMKCVDIHSGIESTLLILKSRIEGSGNHQPITVIKEYGTVPLITCYAGEMNQVFLSLITNAIDAVQDNNLTGKVPTIKIQTQTLTNAHIRIVISDNGTGIASNILGRIFEPFFTTKPVGSGTGLGLSISYAIIKKHGGQLTCNSTLGIHTEFIVEIPINPTIQSLKQGLALEMESTT